jgi:hypothetical protein
MGHARESDSVREEIMILIKDTLSRPPLSGGFCPAKTPRITDRAKRVRHEPQRRSEYTCVF